MDALPDSLTRSLRARPRRWLVTGGAGFIGSHLVEALVGLGQDVRVLDDLSTGHRENVDVPFIEADIRDLDACRAACDGVDVVLHQAALVSVPRSIADPLRTHSVNVSGFLNMLVAAREGSPGRFVYASSSSAYGDEPTLPKIESRLGAPRSPYATGKRSDELYAANFHALDPSFEPVGLRYFNVFGPRQDPDGPYAAVIPRWIRTLARGETCQIHGDGGTSRDFTYVDNVVLANLLAATAPGAGGGIFNVACGERTTLLELEGLLRAEIGKGEPPKHGPDRPGDVRHSLADVSLARAKLGYEPVVGVNEGLRRTVEWFLGRT